MYKEGPSNLSSASVTTNEDLIQTHVLLRITRQLYSNLAIGVMIFPVPAPFLEAGQPTFCAQSQDCVSI